MEMVKVAYAMDAPYLAKMFDDSPQAARELASFRAGSVLVTGAVTRTVADRGSTAVVLQSNRDREVRCVVPTGTELPSFSTGTVISVTGTLQAPNTKRPIDPAVISGCELVWFSPDVRVAAATLLWCASDRFSADGRKVSIRRGGELLRQAGLEQPPTGCNEALLLIVNECVQGAARRECQMPWVNQVVGLMKAPGLAGAAAPATIDGTQFATVTLPHGIRMDVPNSWQVNTGAKQVTVREYAAMRPATPSSSAEGARPFIVNLFDRNGMLQASLNVFFNEDGDLTQEQAARLGTREMKELTREMSGRYGLYDIRRVDINGVVALLGEYRMTIPSGSYKNRAVEVFAGPRSFTLTVGYLETEEQPLKDICDRIIWSLRMER
jgi:hypothetical protein